ncbi:MAG: hypothetical protein HY842_12795 [Bacteroidetes bacterium]|nr:hypothetical protein [Bacteroidota bacterium]
MKILQLLFGCLFMLALVSCDDAGHANNCPDGAAQVIYSVNESSIASLSSVLTGTTREYRYREPLTNICTAEHVIFSVVINVVDSVDSVVDMEAIAVTANGAFGLLFPLSLDQSSGGVNSYLTLGNGFLISNVYPAPGPGEIVAGVNVSFPTLGTATADSVFFHNHIKYFNMDIEYWHL